MKKFTYICYINMMLKGHQVVLATATAEKRIKAERPERSERTEVVEKYPVIYRGFLVRLCDSLKEARELARELREDQP